MTTDVEKLESWKQIAGYLDRDIKTVQRWEHQEGLPIHRLLHTGHGNVFALKQELDIWLASRQRDPEPVHHGRRLVPLDRLFCWLAIATLALALTVHILRSP